MATYDNVLLLNMSLENAEQDAREAKFKYVGTPLHVVGDKLFKTIFSNALGFEWFIRLTPNSDHKPNLSLPSISYIHGYASQYIHEHTRNFMARAIYGNPKVSSFTLGWNNYQVNLKNFWAIPFNYLARNLGKILGWTLVAPFTVPVYLGIKAYYGMKKAILRIQANSLIKKVPPQDLAEGYYGNYFRSNNIRVDKLAQYVKPNDCLQGFIKEHSRKLADGFHPEFTSLKTEFNNYKDARLKIAPTEEDLLKQCSDLIEQLVQLEDKNSVFGDKQKSELIFNCGKKLMELDQFDLALLYFSKVPETALNYKEAMQYCKQIRENTRIPAETDKINVKEIIENGYTKLYSSDDEHSNSDDDSLNKGASKDIKNSTPGIGLN